MVVRTVALSWRWSLSGAAWFHWGRWQWMVVRTVALG